MATSSASRTVPARRKKARKVLPLARAPGRGRYDRNRSARERQKDQLRLLLDAAAHVFAERGWAEATVEAIVARAGMSRTTFYEHFDDLRDCLLVLHRKASKAAFRAVEASVDAQADPDSRLEAGVTALLGALAIFPHTARVMFREVRAAGPDFEAIHEQMMSRFVKLVYDGVARSHALGLARRPEELRIFLLVSGIEAVAMRYVMLGEEAKAIEAAPLLIDMVKRTFAPT